MQSLFPTKPPEEEVDVDNRRAFGVQVFSCSNLRMMPKKEAAYFSSVLNLDPLSGCLSLRGKF